MSNPSWRTAEQWLLATLDLPTEARARFLREEISDPDLRERVEALAAAEARCGAFLETPAYEMMKSELPIRELPQTDSEPRDSAGILAYVGSYRLVRELGKGGMSVVYLGERVDTDFEQRVAVKLLHAGTLSEDARRRFRAERQILAQLEHPGIARLLDGGTTEAGLPYLVMDYVIGVPIDRYCNLHCLDVGARVACFLEVCAAVRHAHRNLIVHRDIKPSNILVCQDGRPKLLDFGIAKLLSASTDEMATTEATATWQRVLTPNYASPEQLRGGPITTACDVYSLGVLLYVLLVGCLPHRVEGETFEAMSDLLFDHLPMTPSTAVAAGSESEDARAAKSDLASADRMGARRAIAEARACASTRQLARRLRGDLDTIVMTALHRDPTRRYGSVDALVGDLRRHLDGRPVMARRDSVLYRIRKLVARNRVRVATVAAVVVLTIGFAIERTRSAWQLERERNEKELVATFFVSLFELPNGGPETEVRARTLLDRGVQQAMKRLDSQPGVGASLLHAIGQAYYNLGLYEDSVAAFEQARALRNQTLGSGHPRRGDTLHALGLALHRAGDYEGSGEAYGEALSIRRRPFRASSAAVAETLHAQALLARAKGDYARALAVAEEAWRMRRSLFGEMHAETAQSKTAIAVARWELGDYGAAEVLYLEALAVLRKTVGQHPSLADALCGLVLLYQQREDPHKALPLVNEALAIRAGVFGTDHPLYLETLQTLGIAAATANDYPLAERAFRESLEATERWFDGQHASIGRASFNLGTALARMGRYDEAAAYLERAVVIGEAAVAPGHPRLALARAELAAVRGHTGRLPEAEALFLRSLADLDIGLGADHPSAALVRAELADLLTRTGQLQRADEHFAAALPVVRVHRPESALDTAERELAHARVLIRLDRTREARMAAERARQTFAERLGPGSDRVHEVDRLFATLGYGQQLAHVLGPPPDRMNPNPRP